MMIEPVVVAGIDLANVIYSIAEAGYIETPTTGQDELMKEDTGSDVSVEPYMAEWKDYEITYASFPDLIPDEMGEPVYSFKWPPRVLEEQPLTVLMNQVRDPVLQPAWLGGTPPGVGSLVSPTSTASEHVTLEPTASPDDATVVAENRCALA